MGYTRTGLSPTKTREQWLAARAGKIGASEVASVMGLNPRYAANALYADMVQGKVAEEQSERSRFGQVVEAALLQDYGSRRKREVRHFDEMIVSDEHPWLIATPDGWQVAEDGVESSVQLKTTKLVEEWEEQIPLHVQTQVQTEMLLLGTTSATVLLMKLGQYEDDFGLVWEDVRANPEFQALIVEETKQFLERVEHRDPPPPDGSESSLGALKRLYKAAGGSIVLDERALRVADLYEEAKAAERRAKAFVEATKQQLWHAMGEATEAVLPDGRVWTLRPQSKQVYECDACGHTKRSEEFRVLRLTKGFTKGAAPIGSRGGRRRGRI